MHLSPQKCCAQSERSAKYPKGQPLAGFEGAQEKKKKWMDAAMNCAIPPPFSFSFLPSFLSTRGPPSFLPCSLVIKCRNE